MGCGIGAEEGLGGDCLEVVNVGEGLAEVGLGKGPCSFGRRLLPPRRVFVVDETRLGSCCLELEDHVLLGDLDVPVVRQALAIFLFAEVDVEGDGEVRRLLEQTSVGENWSLLILA